MFDDHPSEFSNPDEKDKAHNRIIRFPKQNESSNASDFGKTSSNQNEQR
jgi:hypothetical protein